VCLFPSPPTAPTDRKRVALPAANQRVKIKLLLVLMMAAARYFCWFSWLHKSSESLHSTLWISHLQDGGATAHRLQVYGACILLCTHHSSQIPQSFIL
jgi:hypothetical protein